MSKDFISKLEDLLEEARFNKQSPKVGDARNWAVVATDLEKVLAYDKVYLSEKVGGDAE